MSVFPSDVEYAERGDGPALLFLPGSFGTGAGWRAVMDALGAGYRCVTTSLLGYGATGERRPPTNSTMQPQIDVLDAIVERIAEPVHIVAHSFGGLSALAHAMSGRAGAASLILIEANPLGLLRVAEEDQLYATFGAMTEVYFADFASGKADAARHVIDFYGGRGAFASMPEKVRDYIMRTTGSNIRDWTAGTAFEPPLAAYAAIEVPTVVVRGGNGHPAMMRIAEILATALPHARLETIAGGSHFLPTTHPGDITRIVREHVAANS